MDQYPSDIRTANHAFTSLRLPHEQLQVLGKAREHKVKATNRSNDQCWETHQIIVDEQANEVVLCEAKCVCGQRGAQGIGRQDQRP
mgnify:CR=1 FL=1